MTALSTNTRDIIAATGSQTELDARDADYPARIAKVDKMMATENVITRLKIEQAEIASKKNLKKCVAQ